MTIRNFLVVLLLAGLTGGLTSSALTPSVLAQTLAQQEELLGKAQAALLWFRELGTDVDQRRVPAATYHEQITPVELIQAVSLLHSFHEAEQTALAEKLLMIFPLYRLTPEESFEVYDMIGDAMLFELGDISTEDLVRLPTEANRFRTQMLNNAERVVLYTEPTTALELMKAIDVLSVVGRPVLVRHYLRKYLAGAPATTPEEAAKIVETIGTQKLMQLAINPDFVPLAKEAVANIIDEAKKHWQDEERIAEALRETQWFTDETKNDETKNETKAGMERSAMTDTPQLRPEALPALRVLWKGDRLSVQQVFEKLGTLEDEREADELTAVLLSLRPDMKEALAVATESFHPTLMYRAARGLAASVSPQESFLLYPFLLNDNCSEEKKLSEAEREAIKNILAQRRITIPSHEQAAAILFERATDYFERRRPLRTDADGMVAFWFGGIVVGGEEITAGFSVPGILGFYIDHDSCSVEHAYLMFANQYYGQSLEIIQGSSENFRTYRMMSEITRLEYAGRMGMFLDTDASLLEHEDTWLRRHAMKHFEIADHFTDLLYDPDIQLEDILQQSLEKNCFHAATIAVFLLSCTKQIGGLDLLTSTNGKPRPLVQAVVSKDRNVRFAALYAITNFNQKEPFAGSSLVAETLVWFSRSEGQRVILSGHPQMATANQTASLFLGLDYKTDVATTCRDLFRLAATSPDVEAVFVDARTPGPPVGEFVQVMRQDARTAEIPIAVLGGDLNGASPGDLRPPLFGEYPRLASEEAARWVLNDLLVKTSSPHVIPAQAGIQTEDVNPVSLAPRLRGGDERGGMAATRLEQARQALVWLREIKEVELKPGALKIFHFDDFDAVVLDALHSARRVREGLDLAAVVRSPVLQSAIYDLAANAIYPMELREYAGDAFEQSVQRFGILLRGQQIQRLYDRYNASEFEPRESQVLLGRLLDVVEESVRQ
ncbi:MAG: hypothetical protein FWE95_06565 [Planctomycetaceae bacterium]|nr:hypothetical protein [Planctomycetaceae bacterium]